MVLKFFACPLELTLKFPSRERAWNGFEKLVTVYVREGWKTVRRYRNMVAEGRVGEEYLDHASELETLVTKWNRVGMKEVVKEALAA